MVPTTVRLGLISFALLLPTLNAWCMSSVDPAMFEVDRLRRERAKEQEWASQGKVAKQALAGFYQYWPFGRDAFTLEPDGTGKLHGGVRSKLGGGGRGVGTWLIVWSYEESSQTLVIRSQQVKRQYKAIRKDGKVWMIEGREIWRQGSAVNTPLGAPLDKAQRAGAAP